MPMNPSRILSPGGIRYFLILECHAIVNNQHGLVGFRLVVSTVKTHGLHDQQRHTANADDDGRNSDPSVVAIAVSFDEVRGCIQSPDHIRSAAHCCRACELSLAGADNFD
jgi:hypothetical protein